MLKFPTKLNKKQDEKNFFEYQVDMALVEANEINFKIKKTWNFFLFFRRFCSPRKRVKQIYNSKFFRFCCCCWVYFNTIYAKYLLLPKVILWISIPNCAKNENFCLLKLLLRSMNDWTKMKSFLIIKSMKLWAVDWNEKWNLIY